MDYSRLVETYEFLEATSARLKKVEGIASLLEETPPQLLERVTLLIQGTLFPAWDARELGIANQLMVKAIAQVAGYPESEVVKRFSKEGDLGLVIESLVKRKKQTTLVRKRLTVEKVFDNLQAIAAIEGKGAVERKLALVAELLSFATPKQAKYIARTTLGTLRVGVAEGVVRDSVAKAFFTDIIWGSRREKKESSEQAIEKAEHLEFHRPKAPERLFVKDEKRASSLKKTIIDTIEMAWFLRPDYGEIATIAREKGLKGLRNVHLKLGQPYHVLLSEKAPSLEEALNEYEQPALEWKYDGARLSIHLSGKKVWLFTRQLEDVTKQFPEVVEWAREAIRAREAIVEGEMVAFQKGKPMPFQFLSQRIKRKYDIEKMAKDIPVQVNLFDCVFLNGKSLFSLPLQERWASLKKHVHPLPNKIQFAKHIETTNLKKAEVFYKEALKARQEGLIVKNLEAVYQPGRRVTGGWLKVKPTLENLDLVIIGATWGTGKRTGWLGSFVLGCRDPASGNFLECGMIGTGIKEKEESGGVTFKELTKQLKPLIQEEKGNQVVLKPQVVVEVAYEEIQKSPTYRSGWALRFPRVVRLREDKGPQQADSLGRLERIVKQQKA